MYTMSDQRAVQQLEGHVTVLTEHMLMAARGQGWDADTLANPCCAQAKGQAECYEYIFEAALRMRDLGIDASRPPPPPQLPSPVPLTNGHASAPLWTSRTSCLAWFMLSSPVPLANVQTSASHWAFTYYAQIVCSNRMLSSRGGPADTEADLSLHRQATAPDPWGTHWKGRAVA